LRELKKKKVSFGRALGKGKENHGHVHKGSERGGAVQITCRAEQEKDKATTLGFGVEKNLGGGWGSDIETRGEASLLGP